MLNLINTITDILFKQYWSNVNGKAPTVGQDR